MRQLLFCTCLLLAWPLLAAEHAFDFSDLREGQTPPGFRSTVSGIGKPGDWKILLEEVPPMMKPLSPEAAKFSRRPVLAQLSQDTADEHFPMLIFEEESFKDFKLTTRFKTVRGSVEQMAGIAFRIQNETNFYVVRASSLGNTFKFYKVVNGQRGNLIGPEIPIPSGAWHELVIECKGADIQTLLDGKEVIPTLHDFSFASGKIGFWTKSDSVSYFADTKILYTPRVPPAQNLVKAMSKKYPRLLALKVYVPGKEQQTTRLVGSKEEKELGQPGGNSERNVIKQAQTYYGKERDSVSVIMPLRDRNGEAIAAARVVMKSFPGQSEENAIIRATPIVKELQNHIQSLEDLVED